ncbi:MAG: GTP-binding protein [Promethearchaeota archaeon]|nr:MAG: GTP-binding protein [Candidatus Lokiarchaeota archaeon]
MEYNYLAKAVLIGDGGTGKSSLIEQFSNGTFSTSYLMTVGANFYSEIFEFGKNGDKLKIIFWDLAGQEQFDVVRTQFYMGTMICMAVFDLTRYLTLTNLENWFNEMYNSLEESAIPTVIIGNKLDLEIERSISDKEATKFVKSLYKKFPGYKNMEIPYFETSAKTGENVEKAFRATADLFLKSIKKSAG